MNNRNRALGWKHAKYSGHKNENLVKDLLDNNPVYSKNFLNRIGFANEYINCVEVGGLHETKVPSVNGNKTKPKTDLKIFLQSGQIINISIKKSLSGQVYFVGADIFIKTFEKQFRKKIPNSVKRAINLFWSAADDAISIIEQYGDKNNIKNYDLQIRHKSLNATTLKAYDENLYNSLLKWFADNTYEIAKLSFSMGAIQNHNEWSDYIWYINLLGENDIDQVFSIEEICNSARTVAYDRTYFSTTNGGTTIQLPFGFVQWHQKKLQFHHKFEKICNIL